MVKWVILAACMMIVAGGAKAEPYEVKVNPPFAKLQSSRPSILAHAGIKRNGGRGARIG
jgi:hypothetical protein